MPAVARSRWWNFLLRSAVGSQQAAVPDPRRTQMFSLQYLRTQPTWFAGGLSYQLGTISLGGVIVTIAQLITSYARVRLFCFVCCI